jgi:hypothetical protein
MGSKKVFITGVGWCYEIISDLKSKSTKKSKNNVTGDKKVRTLKQTKKSK